MGQSMKNTNKKVFGSPRVVACIPAYNEESYIGSIVLRTTRFVTDVIVCNDGSKDLTGEIAEKLGCNPLLVDALIMLTEGIADAVGRDLKDIWKKVNS